MGRDTDTTSSASALIPKRMGYSEIWKVARTWDSAFESDPLFVYLRAGAKPRRSETRAKLFALRHLIQTIDGGNAFIIVCRISADRPKHGLGIGEAIHHISDWIDLHYLGAEQRRRLVEHHEMAANAIKEALGERISRMTCVNILATAPECRRRGYGGALLESINRWADSSGQAVYLQSSNPVNERFYNSHGYQTIGMYCLGENNEKWGRNPIPMQIMVREPQATETQSITYLVP